LQAIAADGEYSDYYFQDQRDLMPVGRRLRRILADEKDALFVEVETPVVRIYPENENPHPTTDTAASSSTMASLGFLAFLLAMLNRQ